MLAMTSVIVDYMFNNVFLTFYILQAPSPPQTSWGLGQLTPLLSLSMGMGVLTMR